MRTNRSSRAAALAVLAAALYALSTPVSKVLLGEIGPSTMAGLMYLGAGAGVGLTRLMGNKARRSERPLEKHDGKYVALMILLDIAAPVLMMLGLTTVTGAAASLLNNFEIVATALLAKLLFREKVTARLWLAIGVISVSSALLSVDGADAVRLSPGALLILGACLCWGLENNCTRRLSDKDPRQIVVWKGFGSGTGATLIAMAAGETMPPLLPVACALLLGYVAYGLSITCYIYAQRSLGAAKTSAYYAVAPFLGVLFSWLMGLEMPGPLFWPALALMALGVWLITPQESPASR